MPFRGHLSFTNRKRGASGEASSVIAAITMHPVFPSCSRHRCIQYTNASGIYMLRECCISKTINFYFGATGVCSKVQILISALFELVLGWELWLRLFECSSSTTSNSRRCHRCTKISTILPLSHPQTTFRGTICANLIEMNLLVVYEFPRIWVSP